MKKKPKSLGQIAYEAQHSILYVLNHPWKELAKCDRAVMEMAAQAVKRAVLKRMKEGK